MYKVLIVEDELKVCRGLSVLVDWEILGFSVSGFCSSGTEAQRQLAMERYDLVLCDIHIPGVDGLELIHWMRQQGMSSEIIVISAYADFEYAQRAISDGIAAYLLKPVNEALLENSLRKIKSRLDAGNQPHPVSEGGEGIVSAAVAEIHNGSKNMTAKALAKKLYVSTAQLNSMFHGRFNMSVKEYINSVRMERAKFMLERSDKRVYEIAEEVGFRDIDYFTRLFKQDTGMTPKAYRNQKNQNKAD